MDYDTQIGPLGVSSIVLIESVVKIEQELDIEISSEYLDISNIKVLGDLIEVINKSIEEQ